jgi:hypothetical protein
MWEVNIKKIIDGIEKECEKDVNSNIRKEARNNKKKMLVIFDNSNILRWLKRIKQTRRSL